MTHYQPPKIGFDAQETKRLDAMGWPNHLIGAREGEIALAFKAWQDNQQKRTNRRMFWMMVALIVPAVAVIAAQAWGWV